MRILVTVASRHGATTEIAERIGDQLRDALGQHDSAIRVEVRAADQPSQVDDYDAVVLGSAVYLGRWLEEARRFAKTHTDELTASG